MFDEVMTFLKANTPTYIATVEGDAPRVRPMGYVGDRDGKIIFASFASSSCTKQIQANPNIEVSSTAPTRDKALRIKGKAAIITDRDLKLDIMEETPGLKRISEDPDGITMFYIDEPVATFWSYTGVTAIEL